jgi:hypothetical protein
MAISYFLSKDVKIFPATYRGSYEADGKINVFDPEAKLISEYNYTNLPGVVAGKKSYVLDLYIPEAQTSAEKESCFIKFVIDGYYFEVSGEELYDLLSAATNLTFTAITRNTTLIDSNASDCTRKLQYLASHYDLNDNSLDTLISKKSNQGIKVYRCVAVAADTGAHPVAIDECYLQGVDLTGKSAAGAVPHDLEIKKDGRFYYKNFLSNLVPVYSENASSAGQGEIANLEIGYNTLVDGQGAIAIGAGGISLKTSATGEDAIAIGRKASANIKALALGANTEAVNESLAIGYGAKSTAEHTITLGNMAESVDTAANSIIIGDSAKAKTGSATAVVVGCGAESSATNTISVGSGAKATTEDAISIGKGAQAEAKGSIAFGTDARVQKEYAIAIGNGLTVDKVDGDISVGRSLVDPAVTRTYQRTILGQYNDNTRDGSFVIATGADASHRKTSCTFNSNGDNITGTIIYENLTIKPETDAALSVTPTNTAINSSFLQVNSQTTLNGNTALVGSFNITGNTNIDGNLVIGSDGDSKLVNIFGNTSIDGELEVKEDFKVSGSTSTATFEGPVTVKGTTVFESQIQAPGIINSGALTVDGAFTLGSPDVPVTATLNTKLPDIQVLATKSGKVYTSTRNEDFESKALVHLLFDMAHPVNSIFQTVEPTLSTTSAVASYFRSKFGVESSWEVWAAGKVLVGVDVTPGSTFSEVGSTGGAETKNVVGVNAHTHTYTPSGSISATFTGSQTYTGSEGASHTHSFSTDSQGSHTHSIELKCDHGTSNVGGAYSLLCNNTDGNTFSDHTTSNGNVRCGYAGGHYHSGTTNTANTSHSHSFRPTGSVTASFTGNGGTTSSEGTGATVSVVQPYQVCYMYKRVS